MEAAYFAPTRTPRTRAPHLPGDEDLDPATRDIVLDVLDAVGQGDYEQGVFDRPEPVVYPVLSGPVLEVPEKSDVSESSDLPEFLPGWPEEWKRENPGGGWIEDEWVYPEEEDVSGFGDFVSDVIDVWQGQPTGGMVTAQPYPGLVAQDPSGGYGAHPGLGKVTVDTKTGKVTKCGRRRRRRLLTPTDLNDLAALKTIVGGGQAMNFAVMKAVRR